MSETLTRPVGHPVDGGADPAPARAAGTTYPLGWLRGIAALVVVTFHAYQHDRAPGTGAWPLTGAAHEAMLGSDAFVDMFFVLSALVLWLPVARSVLAGGTPRSGRMMLYRRLARLLPLYVVIVCVVWALSNPVLPGHWPDLVLHLTFTHVYSDQYIFWTDGPAWSLGVEMHFYVLVALATPLLLRAARRTSSRRGRIALLCVVPVACLAVTAGFLVWATVLTHQDPTNWTLWYGPLSRAGDFGVGMLLAVLVAVGVRRGAPARLGLALLGVLGTTALVMTRPFDTLTGELWHVPYSVTIALGMAAIVLHDGPWPRWLSWRPLAWVGGLGYGVYLLHEPVMRVLDSWGLLPAGRPGWWFLSTAAIVVVPTLVLAWVSSQTVERLGAHMLAAWTRDGSPRDYYAHLDEPEV